MMPDGNAVGKYYSIYTGRVPFYWGFTVTGESVIVTGKVLKLSPKQTRTYLGLYYCC